MPRTLPSSTTGIADILVTDGKTAGTGQVIAPVGSAEVTEIQVVGNGMRATILGESIGCAAAIPDVFVARVNEIAARQVIAASADILAEDKLAGDRIRTAGLGETAGAGFANFFAACIKGAGTGECVTTVAATEHTELETGTIYAV